MFFGGKRPLAVVAGGMNGVAMEQRTKRTAKVGDGSAGRYRFHSVRIALNVGNRIDYIVTGADHMSLLWCVGSHKGCIRRCNGHAVPRLPKHCSFSEFWRSNRTFTYFRVT